MIFSLSKLKHQLSASNLVEYFLGIDDLERLALNPLIGKKLSLSFNGDINCVACNRNIKKTFNNGYCFPCLQTLAECDLCIVKPELCHYDAGTCRDNDFAAEHCNIEHSIYLSLTSGPKVGITRTHQERSRWIDQGATQALRLLSVARRKHAGMIEVKLAEKLPDKTDWRKMLRGQAEELDLQELAERSQVELRRIINELLINDADEYGYLTNLKLGNYELLNISYPVTEYPVKINSHNFDKESNVEGILLGIKGQYLILDTGVLNMRKFAGYKIEFTSL